MITPKIFLFSLIGTFVLGFGIMFAYHQINKPTPEIKRSDKTLENKRIDSAIVLILNLKKEFIGMKQRDSLDSLELLNNNKKITNEHKQIRKTPDSGLNHVQDSIKRSNSIK